LNTTPASQPGNSEVSFPLTAWHSISVEAADSLSLYGKQNLGHLEVTVHNRSAEIINPGPAGEVVFSFRLLDDAGGILPMHSVRTPLESPIAPGTTHRQKVTVIIPPDKIGGASAIRVGLIREGEYWVEQLNPEHPATVQINSQQDLTPLEARLGAASQIWPQRQGNGMRWPYGSMMVSESHKLLYIPVAKCACTSLKSMMVQLAAVDNPKLVMDLGVHLITDHFNTGVQLKDKPIELAREILASDQYFKFSVIREPFERLVSAYLEKFVYKRHSQRNLVHTRPVISAVQRTPDIDLQKGISFDEFVQYILQQDPFDLDAHWRPQHLYFRGVRHMSKIYRLENISQLESYLLEHHDVTVKLGHENRTMKSDIYLPEACNLPASEFDKREAIKPDSFLASRHVEAIREYYIEDYEFYGAAS
jgi:hypothetical protein